MAETVQHSPFGVRFSEAIDYLKGKLPESSMRWDDLAGPVHGKVFTVAGATTASLAGEIQQALQDALAQGTTITDFRKQFDQVVARHGWTYRGSRGWRTSLIFNTNMRAAHMAGRWKQVGAAVSSGVAMFGEYRTAGDARVRPQHRAWNGRIYRYGDSFWMTHYPPNGWGCRCTIRWYTERQLSRKGLTESDPFPIQMRDVVASTGEITDRVPIGIDPGWDHNVGMSWISPELSLGAKLARLPRILRGPITDKSVSPAFQEAIASNWKAFQSTSTSGQAQIVGYLDEPTMAAMETIPGMKLKSSCIAAFNGLEAGSWPAALVDELPKALRSYRAILWDDAGQRLMVVLQDDVAGRPAVVAVQPNVKTKFGTALSIVSLEAIDLGTLASSRFRTLIGKVR